MLRGNIFITDNLQFLMTIPDDVIVISMAEVEDNIVLPCKNYITTGSCLLPPTESYIAESDGDEDLYELYYINHMNSGAAAQFINAIIAALYRAKSLLLYTPRLNCTAIVKFRKLMYILYGIGIGVDGGEPCQFDSRCIPIWLNAVYLANVIGPDEYLINYPTNKFDINAMNKLIEEYKPFGNNYETCMKEILRHQLRLKEKPATKLAIHKES